LRALWFILPLFAGNYAVAAAIRGLWAGPWLEQVHHADATQIGRFTLAMGLAMVAGSFCAGPATRLLGGARQAMLIFTFVMIAVLLTMWLAPGLGPLWAAIQLIVLGFFGSGYPLLMAHGKSFLPQHLVGRGVTFLNMFSIGGAGIMQFASRPVFEAAQVAYPSAQAFAMLWLFFLIPLVVGFLLYFLTPEADNG
jgi:predicted MFS family arabinose efflux permease